MKKNLFVIFFIGLLFGILYYFGNTEVSPPQENPEAKEVLPSEFVGKDMGNVIQTFGEPDEQTKTSAMGKAISVYFLNEKHTKATFFYSRIGKIEKTSQGKYNGLPESDPWLNEP